MSAIPTPAADLRARLLAHPDFSDADRAALVQLLDQQRRYGLVWEDKPEAVEETLRQFLPVLEEVPARRLEAPEASAPQHTLIEGDNLHALTVLSYTHAAQVDVIYIDPPYNTGNRDFMYNDRFVDREDGYRHSKWLSFMAKRLKLAKTLLKETGVIFISIDDNEQAQLKLLCDEVFGEENFVANVVWQKKYAGSNDHKTISPMHDFLLVYRKSDLWQRRLLKRSEKNDEQYKYEDGDGVYRVSDYTCAKSADERPNLFYAITNDNTGEEVWPKRSRVWAYGKEQHEKNVALNLVSWGKDGKGKTPGYKRYKHSLESGVVPNTWWDHEFGGHNDQAKKELLELFAAEEKNQLFTSPKPTLLIQRVLQIAAGPDALIVDFFAGSGTTLHATMALNAEDGGTRRCILVTNNENNICEQVTYERNRRVIQGYTTPKGVAVPGLANNNLRYYRCVAPVPRTPTLRHKRELVRRATDMLCLKENCYLLLPSQPAGGAFAAFGSPTGACVVVYDDLAVEDAAAYVAALPRPAAAPAGSQPWCAVYVFAPGSYAYQDEFAAVADRVRLSPLPESLYRAWQHLLPQEGAARAIEEDATVAEVAAAPLLPEEADEVVEAAPKTDKRGNLTLF